jgi:hypothetical protein
MLAMMLEPCFKSLNHCVIICLASKYDAKIMIPLLMARFDRLNPTSQACTTIINVPNFQFEKKKDNMFGVGTSMEESSHVFVAKKLFY